jgi:microsomal epoxide hydrolase
MQPERFEIAVADEVLDDLRRRLLATRWPGEVGNEEWGYGFNGTYLRELVDTWLHDYDWRAVERRMNEFDHYRVTIDDVPVHFVREPGRGPAPIPIILNHGWPSTFWDMHEVIRPLADPAAYGGDPADAFDVIVPSLPGFAFSTPVPRVGVNGTRTADLWHELMTGVLGYERFAVSGGDWGAHVTSQLGHKYASSLYGVHLLGPIPLELFNGERWWDITAKLVPYESPAEVRAALLPHVICAVSHVAVQTIEPQTLAYAMHDSPVGQLAWITQRWRDWGATQGDVESVFPRELLLTTAMLYWVTESFGSSTRFYADAVRFPWQASHARTPVIEAPTGFTLLGTEPSAGATPASLIDAVPGSPGAGHYNVHFVNTHPTGGHFGHIENPQACVDDLRAMFRPLRA